MTDLIEILRKYMLDFKLKPYSSAKNGVIRYVVARKLEDGLLFCLVVKNQNFAGKEILYKKLCEKFGTVSFYININNRTDSAVFDKTLIHKYGTKNISASLNGIKFSLYVDSFLQTNLHMASQIYADVSNQFKDCSNVLDLFSGIGITSLIFAKNGANVLSIESEKSSVCTENELIKLNNLSAKIKTICSKCENALYSIGDFLKNKDTSIFLDPPRSGAEKSVLNAITNFSPKKIVYLSCDLTSLSRDLKFLTMHNYIIKSLTPYDMFPHTNHIENLAVLVKQI